MGRLMVLAVGLAALVGSTAVKADPVGGRIGKVDSVLPGHTDRWKFMLHADEVTRIRLVGDGDTGLELRVYDENKNLVVADTVGFGDRRQVLVRPRWIGKFSVEIRNLGAVSNRYALVLD
jgi:hypothetical protein